MDELTFILGLMRENTNELGFIPLPRLTEYMALDRYLLIPRKGYLLHGAPTPYHALTITQACIDYDFRERGYGQRLVEQLVARAKLSYASGVILRCAEDLDANAFWASTGFECIRILRPNNRRHREINVWWRPLLPTLFDGMTQAVGAEAESPRDDGSP